ncbi:imelysin family protein [Chitinophaga sp. 212800010-3]|uniref:imelysin family protein n=1 Tax=unclassified Chitinophaga TaxID=2619133 RepID=UPI002DEAF269|nr:Peptidase-M75 domain-containing protein [Chitinophaga sp. 212800010-3]
MKLIQYALAGAFMTCLISCSKSDKPNTGNTTDFNTLKTGFITDFTGKTAIPGYNDLAQRASAFNDKVTILKGAPTETNLATAKQAWRDMRATWEQCEGFLFGPVEDDNLDPSMDTWPVDKGELDAVINSSNALEVSDIQKLPYSLRGYHPIEYILWGADGSRKAAGINAREMKYISSLTTDLKQICDQLANSWIASGGNYSNKLLTAGNSGNTLYPKRQDVFIAVVSGMAGICEEVGNNKMKQPFDQKDGTKVESPFSGNSVTDFRNNIAGAYAVYTGTFLGSQSTGLSQVVAARNAALNKTIQEKFQAAIASFDAITLPYEKAILDNGQRVQCQNTMNAINALQDVLSKDLKTFVINNITD